MACYRPRHQKNGFTLIEIMIVLVILVVLVGTVGLAVANIMRVAEHESYSVDLEKDGYSTLERLSELLRPAILPVPTAGADRASPFRLLDPDLSTYEEPELTDRRNRSFACPNGRAWRTALQNGMNGLAFVVPVDIKGVGDFLDDDNRLQIGQVRPDGNQTLDTDYTDNGLSFRLRTDVDASSLIHVNPALVVADSAGGDRDAVWPNAVLSGPAATQAFTVIRYIPRVEDGQPAVIRESELGLDLDQDGELTGVFNIGRLQAVYVGGNHTVRPTDGSGTPVRNVSLDTVTVDFTGDVVLRNTAGTEPFFRLVRYSFLDIDSDGIMALGNSSGVMALQVRLNLFDLDRYETLRPTLFGGAGQNGYSAWIETVISLRNMIR